MTDAVPLSALPPVTALIAQQRWAMQTLLAVCAALPAEVLDTGSVGGYGTIRATLLHIVASDLDYLARVDGSRPQPGWDGSFEPARLGELVDWSAAAWQRLCAADDPAQRPVDERDGGLWCRYPLSGLLLQAYQHGTEHRSQICSTLTACGITPPELSVWEWLVASGNWQEGDDNQG